MPKAHRYPPPFSWHYRGGAHFSPLRPRAQRRLRILLSADGVNLSRLPGESFSRQDERVWRKDVRKLQRAGLIKVRRLKSATYYGRTIVRTTQVGSDAVWAGEPLGKKPKAKSLRREKRSRHV